MKPIAVMRARGASGGGGGGGAWTTVFTADAASSSESPGWGGYTLRAIPPASIVIPGSKVRLTLRARSGGCVIAKAYLGVKAATGDYWDFKPSPKQVKFGGANGVSIPANSSVVTDDISIVLVSGDQLILAVYFASGNIETNNAASWAKVEKAGDDAATEDASGYSGVIAGKNYLITKIEIFSP